MSKKSQEILYDSEEEYIPQEQQEQQHVQEIPQNVNIVAPKPQRAKKPKINIPQVQPPQPQEPQVPPQPQVQSQPEEKQKFECKLCHKMFARNYYLNRHIDEGRCNVKRNMDLAKQKQMEENERLILEKMRKRDERIAKKEAKAVQPVKQVKKPPQPKQQLQQPPQRPPAPAPIQHQSPYSNFIINF
jgi:hypothetical protein